MAGILEGEGSFRTNRNIVNKKLYLYPQVVVSMTDEDVISKIADIFGAKVYQLENGRRRDSTPGLPLFRTLVSGTRAAALMRAILPLMGQRRTAKINEVLAAHDAKPDPNDGRRLWAQKPRKTR